MDIMSYLLEYGKCNMVPCKVYMKTSDAIVSKTMICWELIPCSKKYDKVNYEKTWVDSWNVETLIETNVIDIDFVLVVYLNKLS